MTLSRENNELFPVKRGVLHQTTAVAVIAALVILSPGLPFYQAFADDVVAGSEMAPGAGTAAIGINNANNNAPGAMTVSAGNRAVNGVRVDLSGARTVVPSGANGLGSDSSLQSQGELGSSALGSEAVPQSEGVLQSAAEGPRTHSAAASISEMRRQVNKAVPDISAIGSMSAGDAFNAGEKAMEPILHQSRAGSSDWGAANGVLGKRGSEQPSTPGMHLGVLDKPGQVLGDRVFKLAPGQTLTFSAMENQIIGLGAPAVNGKPSDQSMLKIDENVEGSVGGDLGKKLQHDYAIRADAQTPAGRYEVAFPGNYQSRQSPDYHFSFVVEVAGKNAAAAAAVAAPAAPSDASNGVTAPSKSGRVAEIAKSVAVIALGAGATIGVQALAATMLPGVFGLVPFAAAWTLLNAVAVGAYFRPWQMRVQLGKSETTGLTAAKIMADLALGAIVGAVFVSVTGLGVAGLLHIHSILFNGIVDMLQGSAGAGVISAAPLLGLMSMAVVGAQSFLLPYMTGKRQPSAMAMQLFPRFLWIGLSVPFALASGFSAPAKLVNYAFFAWNFSMSKPQINTALNVAFLAAAVYAGFMHLPAAVTFLVLAFAGDRAVAFTQYMVGRIAAKGDGKVAPGDAYILDQLSTHPNTDERIRRLDSDQMGNGSKDPYHYWPKTAGFMAVMGMIFAAAGKVVGWSHMWIPLAIGTAISGVMGWFSYKITIAIYGGIPFEQKAKDIPRLETLRQRAQKEVVEAAGITRQMEFFYLPSDKFPGPNAFATGFDQKHSVIAVSQDLLELMTDDEIIAVLSHEINHVKHGDIRLGAAMQAVSMAINWALYNLIWTVSKGEMAAFDYIVNPINTRVVQPTLARLGWSSGRARLSSGDRVKDLTGPGSSTGSKIDSTMRPEIFPAMGMGAASAGLGLVFTPFLLKVFASVWMPMVAQLVQMMYSRTREFHADEGGALLLHSGKMLAEALNKLESWRPHKLSADQRMRLPLLFTLDAIMFVSPMEQFLGPALPPGKNDPPAPPPASGSDGTASSSRPAAAPAAPAADAATQPAAAPQAPSSEGPVSMRYMPQSTIQPQGPHLNSRMTDLPPPGQVASNNSSESLGIQTPRGSFSSRVWEKIKSAFRLSSDGDRNRSLWVFLAGQTAIVFGFQFQAVAQQELVKKDSTELSRLGAVNSAANAAASFTTGPYVNRAPTKRTLVWSGYARAAVLALFPYLFMVGHLTPVGIIGLLAMVSFTQRLSINVSKFAFMKLLAGDEASYNKAYGMARLVSNAASILGPALGGTLMGAAEMFIKTGYGISGGGPIFVIALYGVLMIVSSLINQTLKIPNDRRPYVEASSSAPASDGTWFSAVKLQIAQFAEGFRLIVANRFLFRSMLLNSFDTLITSPALYLVIPVLAKVISAANVSAAGIFAHVPILGWWMQAMMSKEGSYGLLLSAESVGTALSALLLMGGPSWITWADRQEGRGLIGILSAPLRWIGRLTGTLGGGTLERQGKLTYLLDGLSDLTLWGFFFSHSLLAAGGVVLVMSLLNAPSNIVYDSLVNKVLESGSGELQENKAKVLSALDFMQSVMTIAGMLVVGHFMNVSAMALVTALKWLGIIATVSAVISFVEPFLVFPLSPKGDTKAKPEAKK